MFCKYCGNELPNEANFCVRCGKLNEDTETEVDGTVVVQTIVCEAPSPQEEPQQREREAMGSQLLKFSILGLAFGVTYWLSLLGLLFSILARRKLRHYEKRFGATDGRATVGKHLSIVALILSVALVAVSAATMLYAPICYLITRIFQ